MDYKIDKKDLYCRCKLTKFYFKELLGMTGTDTFTVLSSEELDQVSGSGMIWLMIIIGVGLMLVALQLIRVQYVIE